MKSQSFQVRDLKNKIAACLKLIGLKVKSAVLRLLDLEQKLEEAMSEQLSFMDVLKNELSSYNKPASWEDYGSTLTQERAENLIVEIWRKLKESPSPEAISIAYDNIKSVKGSKWGFHQNIKQAIKHYEQMAIWEKEAEVKFVDAEKQADVSVDEDAEYEEYVRNLELSGQW